MRSPWVLVSIVSHSVAIAAAVIAPLVAAVDLPDVHSPLPAYMAVMAKDIELPPAPPRPTRLGPITRERFAVPRFAPKGFKEEPIIELLPTEPGEPGPGSEQHNPFIEGNHIGVVVPPPEPPREQAPFRVSDVRRPRKIVDVAPVYPPIAIGAHVQGVVILEAVIDTRGFVKDVHVLRSIPLLDQAALDAVRQWRYTPTLLNGEPVSVIITVTVNFTLGR